MKILRVAHPWYYKGVIHEAIKTKKKPSVGTLPDSMYTIHNSRNHRGLENDIKLIEKELLDSPNDASLRFHLAKALHAVNVSASVPHYVKRISLGERPRLEEVFWSKYSLAAILEDSFKNLNNDSHLLYSLKGAGLIASSVVEFNDVENAFERAARDRPYRYEPWLHLAELYWYHKRDAPKCYMYAIKGSSAGPIMHHTLFAQNTTVYRLHHLVCWCGSMLLEVPMRAKISCKKIMSDFRDLPVLSNLEKSLVADAKAIFEDYHG